MSRTSVASEGTSYLCHRKQTRAFPTLALLHACKLEFPQGASKEAAPASFPTASAAERLPHTLTLFINHLNTFITIMANIGYYKTSFVNKQSGLKMYTVRLTPYSVLDTESVINQALKDSNIKAQDMAVAFAALGQAIEDFVLNGHSVSIDGLGTFRLTAKTGKWDAQNQKWTSGGADSMDGVDNANIKGVYVRFRPSRLLRKELDNATFFEVNSQDTPFGKARSGNVAQA